MKRWLAALGGIMALAAVSTTAEAGPMAGPIAGLKAEAGEVSTLTPVHHGRRHRCHWDWGYRHCWWVPAPAYSYGYVVPGPSIYFGWGGGWRGHHHHHRHWRR